VSHTYGGPDASMFSPDGTNMFTLGARMPSLEVMPNWRRLGESGASGNAATAH
jgi:hypothetical protein